VNGPENSIDLFRKTYGMTPDRVFSAPGRINLIGEHTDYNGGLALPVAISERTWVAMGANGERQIRVTSDFSPYSWSISLDAPNGPRNLGWGLYPLGVAWLMHQRFTLPQGFNLAITSTVPVGAGLSSSAALESSTAFGLASYLDADFSPLELALIGQEAENSIVGAPTGLMDQITTIFSQESFATLIDFRTLSISHHAIDLDLADLSLLVIDTRVKHSHSSGEYSARRKECDEASQILGVRHLSDATEEAVYEADTALGPNLSKRAKHVITENERVRRSVSALNRNDLTALGPIFWASHDSLRDDFAVSCHELDVAVSAAYDSGAVAARMTGGGFGGSALAIVPTASVETVITEVEQAFFARSLLRPSLFITSTSEGARRDL
jgi:galactokinase